MNDRTGLDPGSSAIPRRSDAGPAPLSSGQELFWLLDRATPGLTAYNVPRGFHIEGRLDQRALERALDALVERHEILRTVYAVEGDHPVQVVRPGARVILESVDLESTPAEAREALVERLLHERGNAHINLATDIPFRGTLLRLGPDDHVLLMLTHHVAHDGWSKSIMLRELGALYESFRAGREADLPPLPIQYGDYAAWERGSLGNADRERQLAYWRQQLRSPLPILNMPTDRPRSQAAGFDGDLRDIVLPKALVESMRALGQRHGASLYMTLLAGWQALLHRYSGQDDIIVGSPTAGRSREETEGLIGYFANALVMRTSFAGDPSFGELLDRVAGTALDAFEHGDVPFEAVVLDLQRGQQPSHAPVFQAVLTMEDTLPAELVLAGARVTPRDVPLASTKFDLTLLFAEHPEGLRLRLAFRTALFDGTRIERLLGHLRNLLAAAMSAPDTRVSALPLLDPEERRLLAETWNATAVDEGPATTIVQLVETHAARVPGQTAVLGEEATHTWAELNARANRIAHWLIQRGAGPETTVGLCLDRSAAMIAGFLGVLKSGGGYVPLPPDLPPQRLSQQLALSGARIVITTEAMRSRLPDGVTILALDTDAAALAELSEANPAPRASPEGLAYVLFTSGSTGTPKGVAVTHANLVHYLRAVALRLGLDLGGTGGPWHCATVSTLAADLGHTAVFTALGSGGTLHVIPAAVSTDPARFEEYVSAHPLDLLKITPSHLRALLAGRDPAAVSPRRWLVLGGEACPWELAEQFLGAGRCRVLNHYGPTETTVGVCTFEVPPGSRAASGSVTVPIGRPLANTRVYVREPGGELAPLGVPGELFVGGPGVTRGYIGQDGITRERFVPDPYAGDPAARLYRTGDIVRWLAGGDLEFLGRSDDQVKIRGFRVEPGEIEATLAAHPLVRQAAVLAVPGEDGDPRLVAFVAGEALPGEEDLSRWAGDRMPVYMVPSQWVRLPQLPLTGNGKVDRRALIPPVLAPDPVAGGAAPRSDAERKLAALFAAVLDRESVGVDQDFFGLGGHSLLAIRLLGRISKTFGVRLALRNLFEAPTVAALASLLDPASPLESQVAGIYREVLKREQVERDQSFFDLGGHSLLAIRLLGRISKATGVRLSLRQLFETPTVRQLAKRLTAMTAPQADSDELDALAAALGRMDPAAAARLMAESSGEGAP
jgi:amino acid adenylation domain-containing protein